MRLIFSPFFLILTALVSSCYAYARHELSNSLLTDFLLALPFLSVWLVPLLYWGGDQDERHPWSPYFQTFAYLSMGWINFLLLTLLLLNIATFGTSLAGWIEIHTKLDQSTPTAALIIGTIALCVGFWRARRGPSIREVIVPLTDLPSDLQGLRMIQISDLHIGPTIRRPYVEHVVSQSNGLNPDLILLTGDIVDGNVKDLSYHAAPLAGLKARYGVYLILGNHDYYSGAEAWVAEFRAMGMTILLNTHARIKVQNTEFMLAGVLDPAVKGFFPHLKPDPHLARGDAKDSGNILRILLAHNPKLAPEAARAGFHLQISGHTHAGQFIPWTWVTRLIHKPHYAGLSKEGSMTVYVSAGTGSWGPPIRLGTSPELTVLELRRGSVE